MDWLREYVLSVTVAGIACAIIRGLLSKKGTPAAMGKLLTGIFMTLAVLHPLIDFPGGLSWDLTQGFQKQAADAVQDGEKILYENLHESITNRVETYILDEAELLGVKVVVDVVLSEELYPTVEWVSIRGDIAPYVQKRLLQKIKELGVAEENVIWK